MTICSLCCQKHLLMHNNHMLRNNLGMQSCSPPDGSAAVSSRSVGVTAALNMSQICFWSLSSSIGTLMFLFLKGSLKPPLSSSIFRTHAVSLWKHINPLFLLNHSLKMRGRGRSSLNLALDRKKAKSEGSLELGSVYDVSGIWTNGWRGTITDACCFEETHQADSE